jgi:hypothetical protein
VSGGSEREKRGGGPAEEERDRVREERPHPAEVSLYIPVAIEPRITFSGQRAGEKDCEEKEDDPANLAGKRRLGRLIVPVPARVL